MNQNNNHIEYLIVGQGLAGSLLYWYLHKMGKTCRVVDSATGGASMAAAGIINPMTGRNYVKSWLVDTALPFARKCYENMERDYNKTFYHKLPVLRALHSVKEENDWLLRTMDPAYDGYAGEIVDGTMVAPFLKSPVRYGQTHGAARVDLPLLLAAVKQDLEQNRQYVAATFEVADLQKQGTRWQWQGILFDKVVFCEGYKAVHNPYFNYLPFAPAKGNILMVESKGQDMPFNLRDEYFITPVGEGKYWIGSGYRWGEWNTDVNAEDIQKMSAFAASRLAFDFKPIAEKAGIRPSMKTRRPVLGEHAVHKGLYIFNGLGTKGTSLGPYFAAMMAEHLVNGKDITEEVHISRYPIPS